MFNRSILDQMSGNLLEIDMGEITIDGKIILGDGTSDGKKNIHFCGGPYINWHNGYPYINYTSIIPMKYYKNLGCYARKWSSGLDYTIYVIPSEQIWLDRDYSKEKKLDILIKSLRQKAIITFIRSCQKYPIQLPSEIIKIICMFIKQPS